MLNECPLPRKGKVKFLGIHLQRHFNWANHILEKRLKLDLIYVCDLSHSSLINKLLVYTAIIKSNFTEYKYLPLLQYREGTTISIQAIQSSR